MAGIIAALAAVLSGNRPERDRKEREQKMLEEARRADTAERKVQEEAASKDKPAHH